MSARNASTIYSRFKSAIEFLSRVMPNAARSRRATALFSRYRRPLVAVSLVGFLVASFLTPANEVFSPGGRTSASAEQVGTFESANCSVPKSEWNLGQTACAVVTGAPDERRIAWVAPNGIIAQLSGVFTGTASDSYSIPTGPDPFAQVGTWTVTAIDNSGVGFASAEFVVRDPSNASANLSISAFGPFETSAGANINYRVEVTNTGPDAAENVVLTGLTPPNTTLVSEVQTSGPSFTCTTSGGGITCTISALNANSTATFSFAFNVNAGTPDGEIITNAVSVSSDTNELHPADNSASTSAIVTSASSVCSLNCPSNITQNNDANQCGAIVSYSSPSPSGSCGTDPVICSPTSGAFFPIGTTAVNCSTQSGGACAFTVTVQDTRPPVQPGITCPPNVTAGEDAPGSGSAVVNYTAPSATGNCVSVVCEPASGSTFPLGTTSVTCTATDSSNNTVTCSFAVIVTSGNCTLTCPGDITQSAAANQCSASVTYQDPSASTTCGTVTCRDGNGQIRHSGDTFPTGVTPITCTSDQGPTCDFSITVVAATAPTITTCAANGTVSVNADCEALMPNLTGDIVVAGCDVTVSQSPAAGTTLQPGTVLVTLTAENSAGQASCTATVTVVDTTPPTVTCPAGTTASAGSSCQAPVPDVTSGVVASDNCTPAASLTVTQSPAAGTMVGVGTTTITVTVSDASNNSSTCTTTLTVTGPQVTALGTAKVWVGLKNSDDVGTKFDLLAEVLRNGSVIGSGQINDVPGGSSGFNNAVLETINLALPAPVSSCAGETFRIRLSVRVAASSGHVSGTARLWFNDGAANSRFTATSGGATGDYFLVDGFALNTAAGAGPKKTADVLVNRNVGGNPFKPFGTWSRTF